MADETELHVALYPTFQNYFRTHKPRFLAVWGKNDPFFLPRCRGIQTRHSRCDRAVLRDRPLRALETHAKDIAAVIRDFLAR
jgi:hypothetical protein